MGGPQFDWDALFGEKEWSAALTIGSNTSPGLSSSRFRLRVSGLYTPEHHFGIEIWDDMPNIPTSNPIDVFLTMQSVSSLMAYHVRTRQVRYHR